MLHVALLPLAFLTSPSPYRLRLRAGVGSSLLLTVYLIAANPFDGTYLTRAITPISTLTPSSCFDSPSMRQDPVCAWTASGVVFIASVCLCALFSS